MPDAPEHSPNDIAPLLRIGLEEGADDARAQDVDATLRVTVPTPRTGSTGGSGGRSRGWNPPSVQELQKVLPQYEISAFIARGGMGAVYKGTQKTLRRAVAIKVLPPEIEDNDRQFASRFKHEAQAMARLSHPNIVAVFDAGETPDGLLYFVMEFIEGTDVAQLIASEGMIEPLRAIQITTAVCEALAFAHEEGIIHRDIKPSNIMLDKRGRVKVADFGLAKTVNLDNTLLTGSNVAMGTPDFIAPEALIPGMKVDQRADIYAVGVMLYQMLTGHIPRGRFELPSGVVPRVDKGFDPIVDKAMQTDRDKRYSTAIEMKTAVEHVAQGSADSLRGSADPARCNQTGDVAAKKEAGRRAESPRQAKPTRAPLILGTATAVILGTTIWLLMDEPTEAEGGAASPKSSVSSSPNLPVPASNAARSDAGGSKSPSAFPPGQWVRPFRQASDIHDNWFKGGGTWEDGWITGGAGTNLAITLGAPNGSGKNWGVRARYRWNERGMANMVLRRSGSSAANSVVAYEFRVDSKGASFRRIQANGPGGGSVFTPQGEPAAVTLAADQEVLVEAFAIGGTLYGRVNGTTFRAKTDSVLTEGGFEAASTQMSYRDIEFINLDGLSETEALKLVGAESPP